jgi:hypothetical protein
MIVMSKLLQKLLEINKKTPITSSQISRKAKEKIQSFDLLQIKRNIEEYLEKIIKDDFKITSKNIKGFPESKKIELIRAFENEKNKIKEAISRGELKNLPDIIPYFNQILLALLEQYQIDIPNNLLESKEEKNVTHEDKVDSSIAANIPVLNPNDSSVKFNKALQNSSFFKKTRDSINKLTQLPLALSTLISEYLPADAPISENLRFLINEFDRWMKTNIANKWDKNLLDDHTKAVTNFCLRTNGSVIIDITYTDFCLFWEQVKSKGYKIDNLPWKQIDFDKEKQECIDKRKSLSQGRSYGIGITRP